MDNFHRIYREAIKPPPQPTYNPKEEQEAAKVASAFEEQQFQAWLQDKETTKLFNSISSLKDETIKIAMNQALGGHDACAIRNLIKAATLTDIINYASQRESTGNE